MGNRKNHRIKSLWDNKIVYVEYGHRTRLHTGWVEGRFMLTISERELERELPALMDSKLKRFMEDHLR
ncbi:hypothetical protein QOZ95_000918 [Paenibacillus brasilensis]|uniref:Phage protein n=2 Tax=Paenibacillus brasilensis TaxID=128574 RepID=A0ABU0KTK6_9BACL|nr:hypothetical protein [Paenibacillus brasilensis]